MTNVSGGNLSTERSLTASTKAQNPLTVTENREEKGQWKRGSTVEIRDDMRCNR